MVKLKIWRVDALSLNIRNERNAVHLAVPIDKSLYNSLKVGDRLQENNVYRSAFSVFPSFFREFRVVVEEKKMVKDNKPETKAKKGLYMMQFKIQKEDMFSLNIKNSRNAILVEVPVDADFYNGLDKGDKVQKSSVYKGTLDIFPELFSSLVVRVKDKRFVAKR